MSLNSLKFVSTVGMSLTNNVLIDSADEKVKTKDYWGNFLELKINLDTDPMDSNNQSHSLIVDITWLVNIVSLCCFVTDDVVKKTLLFGFWETERLTFQTKLLAFALTFHEADVVHFNDSCDQIVVTWPRISLEGAWLNIWLFSWFLFSLFAIGLWLLWNKFWQVRIYCISN